MAAKKKRKRSPNRCKRALKKILKFVTSGKRYVSKNPYTIPEVNEGFLALGLDRYGDPKKRK